MCGIAAAVAPTGACRHVVASMIDALPHRGPDASGTYVSPLGRACLGHRRLSIIDLSDAGRQPMADATGALHLVFNGEIYNYLELRAELADGYPFRTRTDSEVLLAAIGRWGIDGALDRCLGMFAFVCWDERNQTLTAVRDRFGVKPLFYSLAADGRLLIASEIKALHAGGVAAEPDVETWAGYLATGAHDCSSRTFWRHVDALRPGQLLTWRDGQVAVRTWYDFAARTGEIDNRSEAETTDEYFALMKDAVAIRFRSDVPVGINLSGGLDSSALLATVHAIHGTGDRTTAFTFVTGDPAYDELPWVEAMIEATGHRHEVVRLEAADVPALAADVQVHMDEPFGGIPTLAYARLFEAARARGFIVLLDGQGIDEQWAGYDYYAAPGELPGVPLQGSREPSVRPDCLAREFRSLAPPPVREAPFTDTLRNRQYSDIRYRKLPRALRYTDRVSMRSSVELRSPFLDHRLMELAFRQPADAKVRGGTTKWQMRQLVGRLASPDVVRNAPKRPVQTPQREWLRGPLRTWAADQIERAIAGPAGVWLDAGAVRRAWGEFCSGHGDNSLFVWQWISIALVQDATISAKQPA